MGFFDRGREPTSSRYNRIENGDETINDFANDISKHTMRMFFGNANQIRSSINRFNSQSKLKDGAFFNRHPEYYMQALKNYILCLNFFGFYMMTYSVETSKLLKCVLNDYTLVLDQVLSNEYSQIRKRSLIFRMVLSSDTECFFCCESGSGNERLPFTFSACSHVMMICPGCAQRVSGCPFRCGGNLQRVYLQSLNA